MKNTTTMNQSLGEFLRQNISVQDQVDLGLIRNPIVDPHQQIEQIKAGLEHYDDETQDQLGICYSGNLINDDEPTQAELDSALDDPLIQREQNIPETKRSNFWYVSKSYNQLGGYTRYLLANGGERIVTDDELQDNPYFEYKRKLSDSREDGTYETEGNKIKAEWRQTQAQRFNNTSTTISDEVNQCFIKIGTKLYGDVINIPTQLLNRLDIQAMDTTEHSLLNTLTNKTNLIFDRTKLISYLDMFNSPIKKVIKLKQKILEQKQILIPIKIVNINNKTMAIL